MTQGITGAYGINGTDLTIQPTTGRWIPKDSVGIDGYGHFVYPPYREFELTWGIVDPNQINQLQGFFNAVGNTGTVVVDLPKYADTTYNFFSYTGCVVGEPQIGVYFAENQMEVTLLITRIRT